MLEVFVLDSINDTLHRKTDQESHFTEMIIHREIYVLVLFVNLCCSLCKQAIYIGGFFPMQDGLWDASGILPAAEMAVEDINNHPNILKDYELRMVWNNSKVRR